MKVATHPLAAETTAAAKVTTRTKAEAARYSVLRRLAPALKHDMVVNLQAVSMMAEVLGARLDKGTPASPEFHKSVAKINRLAREAVTTCLKVVAWIEPVEDEGIQLHGGVNDCVALLQSNLNFRGFAIRNQVPETEFEVSRVALRNLLAASLITLTDAAKGPRDVVLDAETSAGYAVLSLRCEPPQHDGEALPFGVAYRELDWADVQALALAESVELVRSDDRIVMRLPRLIATTPLKIAPL